MRLTKIEKDRIQKIGKKYGLKLIILHGSYSTGRVKPGSDLDIKSLHRIGPLFRYHVAKDSQLIYGDITDYNEFRAYAFKLYHDSDDLFKLKGLLTDRYQDHLNRKYNENYA